MPILIDSHRNMPGGAPASARLALVAGQLRESAGLRVLELPAAPVAPLPFPDASFDAVMTVFGCEQPQTAAELLRVCKPGGTIALAVWCSEQHVRLLLGDEIASLEVRERTLHGESYLEAVALRR